MMRPARIASLLVTLALTACVTTPMPAPQAEPRVTEAPAAAPRVILPAGDSADFARFYRATQARLLSRGFLRTDTGASEAFTAGQLAQNFERIALFDEYTLQNGRFVRRQTPASLRRWTAPVRLEAHFGASVPSGQRATDRAELQRYAARLAGITGHPIRASGGGNFHVLYMTTEELAASAPLLRRLIPGIGDATLRQIETMNRNTYCSVFAFSQPGTSTYVSAVAVIRAEHPAIMRSACLHEEIAQGLGLPNDSPTARPSIFNDNEEFASLTRHDEALLRILYDPRLSIGQSPEQARPTVRLIASELIGGPS